MRRITTVVVVLLAMGLAGQASEGQAGRRTTRPPVLGTAQLPGDNGKLGQTYTMGFDLPNKLNLTLRSVRYTIAPLVMGDLWIVPERDQKLLVIEFTAQNPNKGEWLLRGDTLRFTAVDGQDVNHAGPGVIARSGVTKERYSAALKPGQKLDLVTGVIVPAAGVVPKLMVAYTTSPKVLRYDLRGIVKPLEAPFADPADPSGATALATIPGQKGAFYPSHRFDIRFDGAAFADSAGARKAERGKRFVVATLTARNIGSKSWLLRSDTFKVTVVTSDGDKLSRVVKALNASSDNDFGRQVEPAEAATMRLFIEAPANVGVSKLLVCQPPCHEYSFDISDVK